MKEIFFLVYNITKSAGTERAVINLSNILAADGNFKVSIISIASTNGEPYYLFNKNIKFYHLGIPHGTKKIVSQIKAYKRIFKEIYRITSNNSYILGTDISYNVIISLLKHRKKIGCSHMSYTSAGKVRSFLRFIFYRKLDALVVLTKKDAEYYKFVKNTYVIPNSLSFEPQLRTEYNSKQIISIGRLNEQKGFDMLLDVIKIVSLKHSDWKFIICGEGELLDDLNNKISILKISKNVKIIPFTKDVINLYKSSSLYVMSSRYEGLPMVLIEAQSCGLPIVSFDCPEGPAQIIHQNEDGYLVKLFDVNELADKINYLIENPNEIERLGKSAFENSKQFSSDVIKQKWLSLFEQV